jgi:hypothetical protein
MAVGTVLEHLQLSGVQIVQCWRQGVLQPLPHSLTHVDQVTHSPRSEQAVGSSGAVEGGGVE